MKLIAPPLLIVLLLATGRAFIIKVTSETLVFNIDPQTPNAP